VPVQVLGEPLTEKQLERVRTVCDPTREKRKRAAPLKPEDIAGLCDVVRDNTRTPWKALLALLNDRFASVRAAADGRAGGYGGRPWGRAGGRLTRGGAGCAGAGAGRPPH
jgi:hypothetical protein